MRFTIKNSTAGKPGGVLLLVFGVLLCPAQAWQHGPRDVDEREEVISQKPAVRIYSDVARVVHVVDLEQIDAAPVRDLGDLLEVLGPVDVRSRGFAGMQGDLSLRGGSFEQVAVLINGVKVNDPQTGHHHLDIPIDLRQVERVEILEGGGARRFGANASCGAINVVTRTPHRRFGGEMSTTYGDFGLQSQAVSADLPLSGLRQSVAVSRTTCEGYRWNTDLQQTRASWLASATTSHVNLDFFGGYLARHFGANQFYASSFPDQFEQTETQLWALSMKGGRAWAFEQHVSYRRHTDEFHLFRWDAPTWYHGPNLHETRVLSAHMSLARSWWLGRTLLGGDIRRENLESNTLGEPARDTDGQDCPRRAQRSPLGIFAEHGFQVGRWQGALGVFGSKQRGEAWHFFPGVDLGLAWDSVTVFASVNRAMRLPSFTELYYADPVHQGNPDLRAEKSRAVELGLRVQRPQVQGHVSLFRRDSDEAIDWVRSDDQTAWQSRNWTRLQIRGLTFQVHITPNRHRLLDTFGLSYTYLDQDKDAEGLDSKYALDYLRHSVQLRSVTAMGHGWRLSSAIRHEQRQGRFLDETGAMRPYEPIWSLKAKASWKYGRLEWFLEGHNLLDRQIMDVGPVPSPGRWVQTGVQILWGGTEAQ